MTLDDLLNEISLCQRESKKRWLNELGNGVDLAKTNTTQRANASELQYEEAIDKLRAQIPPDVNAARERLLKAQSLEAARGDDRCAKRALEALEAFRQLP